MALSQKAEAVQKRHIVYPSYIVRGGGKAKVFIPALPEWEIIDVNEARALTRAHKLAEEYIKMLVRHGISLPLPSDGGTPDRYHDRRFITIEFE